MWRRLHLEKRKKAICPFQDSACIQAPKLAQKYKMSVFRDLSKFQRWISLCNNTKFQGRIPWSINSSVVGYLLPKLADKLNLDFPSCFERTPTGSLQLSSRFADAPQRSAALAAITAKLRSEDLVPGWRNELYPVQTVARRDGSIHVGV